MNIDTAKYDAVPEDGVAHVVGTCDCGGEITKQFVQRVGMHRLWQITCTKGGEACMERWRRRVPGVAYKE